MNVLLNGVIVGILVWVCMLMVNDLVCWLSVCLVLSRVMVDVRFLCARFASSKRRRVILFNFMVIFNLFLVY